MFPIRAVNKGLRLLDAIVGKERILGKVTIYWGWGRWLWRG